MTWASFGVRSVGMLVVLPLIGRKWAPGDVAYWLLLANTVGLLMMVTFGFDLTFSRLISYARAGLSPESMEDLREPGAARSREDIAVVWARVLPTARLVFASLASLAVVLSATVGTWVVAPVVKGTTQPFASWWAWACVAVGVGVSVMGSLYSAYLVGSDEIARLRRWEAAFGLVQIGALSAVVALGGGLLGGVLVTQAAGWASVLRNRWLARRVDGGAFVKASGFRLDPSVWRAAWSPAWRQGVTQVLALGVMQASGPMYAQVSDAKQLSAYLLCLRMSQVLQQLSVTPFSIRLPRLATLRASGDQATLVRLARAGMQRSYVVFVVGFLGIAWIGNLVFDAAGSRSLRIDRDVWHAFAPSILLHVWGGMHSGLYNLTNRLFSHLTAVAFAVVYLVSAWCLIPHWGAFAFPAAAFLAQVVALVHVWRHTFPALGLPALDFERRVGLPAVLAFAAYLAGWTLFRTW